MRRPAGVVAAAVILGVFALLGIFGAVVALGVTFFLHNPFIQHAPMVHTALILFECATLFFFCVCGATVFGLFRMRSWARISILFIGGFIFVICALAGIAIFLARSYAPQLPAQTAAVNIHAVMMGAAAFYFLFSLVGVWWLVYFNLPSVRTAFAAARSPNFPPPPPPGPSLPVESVSAAPAPPPVSGWRRIIIEPPCLHDCTAPA